MNAEKRDSKEKSERTKFLTETTWNKDKQKLKKLALMVLYDIQKLESISCLDLKREVDFFDEVRRFEMNLIKSALLQSGGNQRRCASLLGISTSNLNNKIKHYKISLKSDEENTI